LRRDPEAVAEHADNPVNEADQHARHLWLCSQQEFRERMKTEPDFYDTKIAGWWVWGQCIWIGAGWCAKELPHLGNAGNGLNRQRPHLGNAPRAIARLHAAACRAATERKGMLRRLATGLRPFGDGQAWHHGCLSRSALRGRSGAHK
jgi:hypothetical protein